MNLYVGNLSAETTEPKLRELFVEFGEVGPVKVLLDPATGLPRGFGFVEMPDKQQAWEAIMNLDSTFLLGNIISVKEARPATTGGGNAKGGFNRGNTQFGNKPNRPRPPRNDNYNNSGGGYSKGTRYNNPNSINTGSNEDKSDGTGKDNFNSLDYQAGQ